MPGAQRKIVINSSPEKLFQIITNYEQYPTFLKEVDRVEIISRSANRVKARYTVSLIKKIQYTIELVETPHTSVQWTLIESGIMKHNNGGWVLKDLGNGQTEATYSVDVTPKGIWVPKKIISMLTEKSLPATLAAFKSKAEA